MAYDGSIRISTEIDNKGFTSGRKALESGMAGLKNSLSKLAVTMGAAFGFQDAIQSAESLQNAMMGLQSIVEGQGRSFEQAQAFIQSYISDGLVPLTNAATAYRNLAARGYDDGQIQQVMNALKDSAAFGRQASLSLGEAVQSATEGLRNENSILVDNAGVTKNVAKMWDEYAKSIGTTANNLTQEQKIQAEVNGILTETRFQTGDAAKASESYSGQIAKTAFQFNELKVAIGNLGMTLVQSALPGINALLSSLTAAANTAAQFVAVLFGVEQEKTASSAAKAAKEEQKLATQIAKTAKAAKGAVSSIDELNIVQQDTGSETGAASSGSSSPAGNTPVLAGEIGKDVTLSPNLQKIAEQMRDFFGDLRDALHDFSPLLKGVGTAFAAAFSMKWVAGAVKKFKSLNVVTSISKAIREGLLTMNTNFEATGKLLPSISKGMKEFRSNLSTTAKAMVGAGGFAAAFVTTKNAVSDFVEGEIEADEAIANVAITAGITGAALYTFLGPWGLLIEAIGLAAGALVGYCDAQQRMVEEALDESFYDGVGTGIGEIADSFKRAWEEVDIANDKVLGYSQTLENNRTKTQELQQEIGTYEAILEGGGKLTEEQAAKMEQAYQDLYDVAKENLDTEFQVLIDSYGKHLEAAAEVSGLNVGLMLSDLEKLKGDMNDELSDLTARQSELRKKLIDGTITAAEQEEYNKLSVLIADIASGVSETQTRLDQQVKKIGEINFGNEEKALEALQGIHDTAKQLIDDNNEAKIQAINSIDDLKNTINGYLEAGVIDQKEFDERMKLFNNTATVIEQSYNDKEADIKASITGIYDKIQEQMVSGIEGAEAKLREKWGNESPFTKWLFGNDEDRYVKDGLKTFKEETIGPIADFLETSFDDLELQGTQWATDTMQNVIDAMFQPVSVGNKYNATMKHEFVKPASEAISEALEAIGKEATPSAEEAGKNTMDGMADGIRDNAGQVADAASSAAKGAQEAVKAEDDSHSPSRKYYGFGRDNMEGYRNGILDNASLAAAAAKSAAIDTANALVSGANSQKASVSAAFGNLFNAALDKTDLFCSRMRGAINDMLAGIKDATNSVRLSPDGRISYTKLPPVKIPRLATGAVIPPNAQFAAILGDQTHGRNLEAPEGLIRQIVREESGGSLAQVEDLLERLIQVVQSKDLSVTVGFDDRDVAQAARRGEHNLGYPVRSY